VDPVHQWAAEGWSLDSESIDRVFDEIGRARIVLCQVDELIGNFLDQQDLPRTHAYHLNPRVMTRPHDKQRRNPLGG